MLAALAGIGLAAGTANAGGSRLEGLGKPDSVTADSVTAVKPVAIEAKGKGKGKG
ncbi:hypothetical protein ACFW16_06405 [Inquilinus sp. NPDC058860]|uniref:hypothetical protein n=1 Tax=Inquilinus sp. NPDC058860 TaxID=3346652 RepID=UPI0036BF1CC5